MGTIFLDSGRAWRNWVDRMTPEVDALTQSSEQEMFVRLWYATNLDPKVINSDYHDWRTLVQMAFVDGYIRGTEKKITGE